MECFYFDYVWRNHGWAADFRKYKGIKAEIKEIAANHIQKIDDLLSSVGDYGEVRLVVQNGELRYINRVESHKVRTGENRQNITGRNDS